MKNPIYLLIAAIIASTFLFSCKRGENDPGISFRSRNARLIGTWLLQEVEYSSARDGSSKYYPSTTTVSYNGSILTETVKNKINKWDTVAWDWIYVDTSYTNTFPYTNELTINKDGSYTSVIIDDNGPQEYTCTWSWMDSKKKKAQLWLWDYEFYDTYLQYDIDRLANKELILTYDASWKSNGEDGYWYEGTTSATLTYSKK